MGNGWEVRRREEEKGWREAGGPDGWRACSLAMQSWARASAGDAASLARNPAAPAHCRQGGTRGGPGEPAHAGQTLLSLPPLVFFCIFTDARRGRACAGLLCSMRVRRSCEGRGLAPAGGRSERLTTSLRACPGLLLCMMPLCDVLHLLDFPVLCLPRLPALPAAARLVRERLVFAPLCAWRCGARAAGRGLAAAVGALQGGCE